ncbi:MAG TPA: hypothetical protein VF779_11850 [Pyrinomonadaceae bacterium]
MIYQIIQSLVYFRQNRMVSRRKFLAALIASGALSGSVKGREFELFIAEKYLMKTPTA